MKGKKPDARGQKPEVEAGAPAALLTPEELAGRYAVAKSTVLEWFHKGLIPAAVAVGKVYRFDAAAVADALRSNAEQSRRQVPECVGVI